MGDLGYQGDERGGGAEGAGAGEGQGDGDVGDDAAGAGAHDEDALGEVDGFGDVVGDEEGVPLVALPEAGEVLVEALAGDVIEGSEGFIHEQQAGAGDEGAGDGDAHLHAAGKFGRERIIEIREADPVEDFAEAGGGVSVWGSAQFGGEADVLSDGAPGEEGGVLEDEGDGSIGSGLV